MSVTSKFSPLEIAQNAETGVQCATLEYKSDYLSTDRRCTACMECTTQQPDAVSRSSIYEDDIRNHPEFAQRERITV